MGDPNGLTREQFHFQLKQDALERLAGTLGSLCVGGELLLLHGEMGAGKTTFTRAFAAGLGLDAPQEVCSPTYTVCMTHSGPVPLVHLDLFRLGEMGDGGQVRGGAFEALGLAYEELPAPGTVLVVEWSSLWADPPADRIEILLERPRGQSLVRSIRVQATGPAHGRLVQRWADSATQQL